MKKPKKLLLIGSIDGSVHVKNYYHLVKNYFDEILVIGNTKPDFANGQALNFSLKNPVSVIKSIRELRGIIKHFNPSVIHVHQANAYAYITGKANKGKEPLVLTTWGSDVLTLPKQGFLYKHIVKQSLNKADVLTADAKFMAEAIKELGIKKHVHIVNFGVDINPNHQPKKENIIYTNRLHNPLYNIDKIIQGFSLFVTKNPNWKLVVGANGSLTGALKEQAKNILPSNSYEFIGFVNKEENIKQYLRAKIWVSIPNSDGTAISLLEAMAYGCVPVVSNLPANKEWINHNENGIVVTNTVQQGLIQATQLNQKNVQHINAKIVEEKATKEANRKKFIAIYDKILKSN